MAAGKWYFIRAQDLALSANPSSSNSMARDASSAPSRVRTQLCARWAVAKKRLHCIGQKFSEYGMPETASGLAQFDELVAEVMAEWRIPGLAMAVVRRGEPPLLRCWGLRDTETDAPVTPETLFPICSV